MDVDRFDYMMRDPMHLNQKDLIFHPTIYLDNFKIVDNMSVYNIKIANKIFEFFNHRYKLFKNMYLNRKAVGFDYMCADLFTLVDDHFKFCEIIRDPKRYIKLNNNVMNEIEALGETRPEVKKLCERFYNRDNYKFINEYCYSKDTRKTHNKNDLEKLKRHFLECQPLDSDLKLTEDNVILGSHLFKYCEENQFDTINVSDFDNIIKPASSVCNQMNIKHYYEYQVHMYVKDSELSDLAKRTWPEFMAKYGHALKID